MSCNRKIGLHLRLKNNLFELIQEIQKFNIQIFQFFLTKQQTGKYIKIIKNDYKQFLNVTGNQACDIYVHSSYWINLSSGNKETLNISKKLLKKELYLAKKFKINNLILHPGSATGYQKTENDPLNKIAGIQTLAQVLNEILEKENKVQILLENTTHANKTIGSNIKDFYLLKKMLKKPEKIGFCLDCAHAFSYGYDLKNKNEFIELLDKYLNLEKIKLIHLNDSAEPKESRLDKHEIPGKGFIGKKILKDLINHPKLKEIPIILELPIVKDEEIHKTLKAINLW